MITQQTAADIWHCYREIEVGEELLADIKKSIPPSFENQGKSYQLGVPTGKSSLTLFGVGPGLTALVIQAHIAEKEKELVEANERARIELESDRIKGGPDSSDAF